MEKTVMSVWKQRTLIPYVPAATPELTFYYLPYKSSQQSLYRRKYNEFDSTYELMHHVFCNRLFFFMAEKAENRQGFAWPQHIDHQETLIQSIPDNIVIEVGASILGWKRIPGEDSQKFVNRIIEDLKIELT